MEQSPTRTRGSLWKQHPWLHGILVSLLVSNILVNTASALSPAPRRFPGRLTFQSGKLTAQIMATPLWQVMEEVSRVSNVRVLWLNARGEEAVSAEFTALPISEALKQILKEKNFLLFYTATPEGERLTQVWISFLKQGDNPQVPASPVPVGGIVSAAEEAVSEKQEERDATPLDTSMQIAVYDQNPAIRLAAIMDLETHAGENPKVVGVLSHLVYNDSDPLVQKAAAEALRRLE